MILIALFLCSVSVWLGSSVVLACLAGFHWSLRLCAVAIFPGFSFHILWWSKPWWPVTSQVSPHIPPECEAVSSRESSRLWFLWSAAYCSQATYSCSDVEALTCPSHTHLFVRLPPFSGSFPLLRNVVTKATWTFPQCDLRFVTRCDSCVLMCSCLTYFDLLNLSSKPVF